MKISQSVFLGFALILLLFSITTIVNFRLYRVVNENAEFLSRSSVIIRNSSRFQRNILTIGNGLRGYLLTGEKSFVESYDLSNAENDTLLSELKPLLSDTSQIRVLGEIIELNNDWTEEYMQPVREAKRLSRVSPKKLDSFKQVYKDKYVTGAEGNIQRLLQQKFRSFTNSEYAIREKRKANLSASIRQTRRLSIAFTAVSVLVALVVVALLVRRISRRIGVMSHMANTIATGNYNAHLADVGTDELSSLGRSLNHMAEELSKNISLLQRSNDELEQFAQVVSHDMKGPLRGISNVVSWIEEDHKAELSPKMVEYIDLIKGRLTRGENLINGLLAYARVNKESIAKDVVDVKVLIEEVLENLPDKGSVSLNIGEMPIVRTERILLFQVFSNLIDNAFKHSNKERPEIKLYCQGHTDTYEFFVEDNGAGIDEKYHERIFRIFQTLKERDSFESAGVGLAIVKKILDSKKQTITLNSKPGRGAIFSFHWPKE